MRAVTLGEKLRFYRTAQGIPQRVVARQIGRTRSTYGYYEADRIQPDIHMLYVIARFLRVPMAHLADETYIPFGAEEFLADLHPRRVRKSRKKPAADRRKA